MGKSQLFNTLAGKQQALVANVAGTTRDINRVAVKYKGQQLELLDTAGVRKQGKQEVGIEKFSVLRTLSAIEESDICFPPYGRQRTEHPARPTTRWYH